MNFEFSIPSGGSVSTFKLASGNSMIFVGANGGGKTRLAVFIENHLGDAAHRISAHRALNLNTDVAKISEAKAKRGLKYGYAEPDSQIHYRSGHRWGGQQPTKLLNDFDYLIQVLFADQTNTSLKAYDQFKPGGKGASGPVEITKFDILKDIWMRLLPHRKLTVSGDDITVSALGSATTYKASEMSDGERAIFYMIGQVLVADLNQVLIVDEPELHVHRSIMSKLWDELEAIRPDCAFIFITHDLEFAAARSAKKYVVRDYNDSPSWTVDIVPENTGFDEELTTLILGSRRPVIFVEGDYASLDYALYRCCYPEFTIIPRSSCTEVIHAVATLRANNHLTRVACSGIVDADHFSEDDKAYLGGFGIKTLPVAEIENIFLHPLVSRAIASTQGYTDEEIDLLLEKLASAIFSTADDNDKIELIAVRYAKRRIDRMLKKLDLSEAKRVEDLAREYSAQTESLNVVQIATDFREEIKSAVAAGDLTTFLSLVDDKGLLSLACGPLKSCRLVDFKNWLTRTLRNQSNPEVVKAAKAILPTIEV